MLFDKLPERCVGWSWISSLFHDPNRSVAHYFFQLNQCWKSNDSHRFVLPGRHWGSLFLLYPSNVDHCKPLVLFQLNVVDIPVRTQTQRESVYINRKFDNLKRMFLERYVTFNKWGQITNNVSNINNYQAIFPFSFHILFNVTNINL